MSIPGGLPPMRPDQALEVLSRAGTGPAPQTDVVRAREVIVSGPNGGMFVYNAARTVLESSNTGAATTDPVLGISCPAGFATYNTAGRVICLLSTDNNAFFQYRDLPPAQGSLILSVASTAGTDPVTGALYPAALLGVNPAFGDSLQVIGSLIQFGAVPFTRKGDVAVFIGSGSANPGLKVDAPEQTTAEHMQMLLQGDSPDGTSPSQWLLGRVSGGATLVPITNGMAEIQDSTGFGGLFII